MYTYLHAFVPRHSFPLLNHSQYTKLGGERSGPYYHVNDINVGRQRKGGVPDRKNTFHAHSLSQTIGKIFSFVNIQNSNTWTDMLQGNASSSFFQAPPQST